MKKKNIRLLNKDQLKKSFLDFNEKSFRALQVYDWLWNKGVDNFDQMTNLSLDLRAKLKENFEIPNAVIQSEQHSSDGTIKNAIALHDGNVVESVLIPTEKRTTACVSSQVGCSLNCHFCATALLKRMRNLNADEIFDQVLTIHKQSLEKFNRPLSNVVFMGMGEPLLNYKNVITAIDKITDPKGLGIAPKRITLSTSGIPKMIVKLADEKPKFKLAFSLHAARESVRTKIMPFNKKFPLPEVLKALQYWNQKTKNYITIEYVVWKGINDKIEDINALVKFCKQLNCRVNFIQYNSIGDDRFEGADEGAIQLYMKTLVQNNIRVTLRRSRGKDIDAACGQLANKNNIS